MSAAVERITESGRIARGLHAEFKATLVGGKVIAAECEWDPSRPAGLSGSAWRRYRQLRHRFMTRLAERIGGNVAVVDV